MAGMTDYQPSSASRPSRTDIFLHFLNATSTDAQVARILRLSSSVFGPEQEDANPPQSSFEKWRSNLADPRSQIVYATSAADPDTPLGFFFSYPKVHEELASTVGETLHIWLAGVTPASRGLGIFPLLVEATKAHASKAGFKWLSVCTIPDRFARMYAILNNSGWEYVSWKGAPGEQRRVLLKLPIQSDAASPSQNS